METKDTALMIERLEKATEPDRELDALIALQNGWTCWRSKHGYWNIDWKMDGKDCHTQTHADPFGPRFDPDTGEKNNNFDKMPLYWAWDAHVPEFTSSIDAALTLVPEGFGWRVDWRSQVMGKAWASCGKSGEQEQSWAETPALALCIAALKARAQGEY